jgi:hypothetical protein
MAADAILQVGDALFEVFLANLGRVMFVTAITGVGNELIRVAGPAGAGDTNPMIDGKLMEAVKGRRPPALRRMTFLARGPEQAVVGIILLVTGIAVTGRLAKVGGCASSCVAFRAGDGCVLP